MNTGWSVPENLLFDMIERPQVEVKEGRRTQPSEMECRIRKFGVDDPCPKHTWMEPKLEGRLAALSLPMTNSASFVGQVLYHGFILQTTNARHLQHHGFGSA